MILPIVSYGHRVLRKKCDPIKSTYKELHTLIDNMWETLYAANGCGLAAPQINLPIRLFLVDSLPVFAMMTEEDRSYFFDGDEGIKEVFINAKITAESEEVWKDREGCLSIPSMTELVERPWSVSIEYLDHEFKKQKKTFSGLTARMIQHEVDHTEGILYFDYLTPARKTVIKSKLKKVSAGEVRVKYKMKFLK